MGQSVGSMGTGGVAPLSDHTHVSQGDESVQSMVGSVSTKDAFVKSAPESISAHTAQNPCQNHIYHKNANQVSSALGGITTDQDDVVGYESFAPSFVPRSGKSGELAVMSPNRNLVQDYHITPNS